MVDILLIQPPMADFYLTKKRTIPYGLASMATAVRARGFSVAILDALASNKSRLTAPPAGLDHLQSYYGRADRSPFALFHQFRHFGYSLEHMGNQIAAAKPFLVGISSLFTAYSDMALAVARIARQRLPTATVVLGGHHPTALPEAVMAEPAVDLVLRGEGEVALPALAAALQAGSDLAHVPGIVQRRADGTLSVSDPAVCADGADLPVPAFDLIRRDRYQRKGQDSIVVTASRGCPFACSYCATGRDSWMGFRRRPVSAVLAEIRAASQGRRVGFIDFEDENLTMDRDWVLALMTGIRKQFGIDLPELRAMNGLFPPSLNETVVAAMAQSGFATLNLSLGSADAAQLKRFKRPDVRSAFDTALQLAGRHGLDAVGYIIVGAPGQDPLASVDDLLYLARRPVLAGVSVFYPAPGSGDWALCREQGLLPARFAALRATALPLDQRTSRTEAVTLWRLGRIVNFIKELRAKGIALPSPAAAGRTIDPQCNRQEIGRQLLAAFLHDATICGVDEKGRVYGHRVSEALCRRFIQGLETSR